ncbi:MAG: hypothetical protein K2K38_04905 [Clostridia bacterium]|nr:hypothetical protein [Clostridia bacterium]
MSEFFVVRIFPFTFLFFAVEDANGGFDGKRTLKLASYAPKTELCLRRLRGLVRTATATICVLENGASKLRSSQRTLKVDRRKPKYINRQVKGMDMGVTDKTVQRLKEYLLNEGWTAEKILDLLDFITK